jgi:hypothetical protein
MFLIPQHHDLPASQLMRLHAGRRIRGRFDTPVDVIIAQTDSGLDPHRTGVNNGYRRKEHE